MKRRADLQSAMADGASGVSGVAHGLDDRVALCVLACLLILSVILSMASTTTFSSRHLQLPRNKLSNDEMSALCAGHAFRVRNSTLPGAGLGIFADQHFTAGSYLAYFHGIDYDAEIVAAGKMPAHARSSEYIMTLPDGGMRDGTRLERGSDAGCGVAQMMNDGAAGDLLRLTAPTLEQVLSIYDAYEPTAARVNNVANAMKLGDGRNPYMHYAQRDVVKGMELFVSYGAHYWLGHQLLSDAVEGMAKLVMTMARCMRSAGHPSAGYHIPRIDGVRGGVDVVVYDGEAKRLIVHGTGSTSSSDATLDESLARRILIKGLRIGDIAWGEDDVQPTISTGGRRGRPLASLWPSLRDALGEPLPPGATAVAKLEAAVAHLARGGAPLRSWQKGALRATPSGKAHDQVAAAGSSSGYSAMARRCAHNAFRVGPSTLPGAGLGVFAASAISAGAACCFYDGVDVASGMLPPEQEEYKMTSADGTTARVGRVPPRPGSCGVVQMMNDRQAGALFDLVAPGRRTTLARFGKEIEAYEARVKAFEALSSAGAANADAAARVTDVRGVSRGDWEFEMVRDVEAEEELFFAYGSDYWLHHFSRHHMSPMVRLVAFIVSVQRAPVKHNARFDADVRRLTALSGAPWGDVEAGVVLDGLFPDIEQRRRVLHKLAQKAASSAVSSPRVGLQLLVEYVAGGGEVPVSSE